jgi:hypothetical protein
MIHYKRSAALALTCALLVGGCDNNDNDAAATVAPTPTPTPTPTPNPTPTPTFTVSGTIFETAPTASTRVAEAEVQLTGGVATGSVADGTFTVPNVANGTYTLRVAKAGYETQTRSVTVSGGNVSGIQVNLLPVFRWVDREFSAELKESDPRCPGTEKACRSYGFASHHSGDVRAFAAWTNTSAATADFDFEFWCDGRLVEARGMRGNDHDEILPHINAGQSCEIHVILYSGGPMRYTLYLRYPY